MPRELRDWRAILLDAAGRGLSPMAAAKEQNVHNSMIYQKEKVHGIRLARRVETQPPSLVEPYTPSDVEQWRQIASRPKYEVSDRARVRRISTGHIMSQRLAWNGYWQSNIAGGAVVVHRVMAIAFLSNPEGKTQVNHKDLNKQNNALDNLEWTTREENFRHGRATGKDLAVNNRRVRHKYSAETIARFKALREQRVFVKDAAEQCGIGFRYALKISAGKKRERG